MNSMMEEMIKNCVIYTRVSSEKQTDGYSLDSQAELCARKAQEQGFTVVRTFREEGVSGTTTDRPQLQELLTYCTNRQNNVSAVVIYSLSRLNRNTVDYLTIRHLLSKAGVELFSVTEPTGTSPEHEFIETIFASFARLENQSRARNVVNSLRKRFGEGNITAKPPLGYLMQKVNGKSVAVKDPETFKILKNLWYRTATEKLSLKDIARELNRLGVRSSHDSRFKRFLPQSVSKIFQNKFYMGVLTSAKYGEAQGQHEPMIDETTFYFVRNMIDGRKQIPGKHYKLREDFVLRGLLNCQYCGKKLSSAWSKGKLKKYPYYACGARGVHKTVSFPRDLVEEKFIELLQTIQPSENFIKYLAEVVREKYHARIDQIDMASDQVVKDIANLEAVKRKLIEKHLEGLYTDQEFSEIRDNLETQLAIKRGILSEKDLDRIDIETILEFMVFYLTNLEEAFTNASPEGKLKIGCSMFPDGVVFEGKSFRTPKIARIYELTKEFGTPPIKLGEPNNELFEHLMQGYHDIYKDLKYYVAIS